MGHQSSSRTDADREPSGALIDPLFAPECAAARALASAVRSPVALSPSVMRFEAIPSGAQAAARSASAQDAPIESRVQTRPGAFAGPAEQTAPEARIGPNAILQTMAAIEARHGPDAARGLLAAAGLGGYVGAPPTIMVPEQEVIRLHQRLRRSLTPEAADAVSREAGARTAHYLLLNRIPRPAQWILKLLPPVTAARLLLKAIGGHAWTFVGSGRFSGSAGMPTVLTIEECPLARGEQADHPVCAYYAATFEGLFRALVHRDARCIETACVAQGAPACRFEVRWGAPAGPT